MRTSYLCSVIRKPSAHRFEDYIRFNKVKTKKMTEKNKLVETTNVVVNNVNNNDMKQEVAYKTVKANINGKVHIPEHTRSLSGSLLGYKTIP